MASHTIHTRRMALVAMSSQLAGAIMEGDWAAARLLLGCPFPFEWRNDGWQWLAAQATTGRDDDRFILWGTRVAVPATDLGRSSGPVLAEVGFHGPPDSDGWVEIGYRVVRAHWRRGLAEEAATALLAWAASNGAVGIRASVDADNAASIALLHKLRFTAAGRYEHRVLDEQLSFHRTVGKPSP